MNASPDRRYFTRIARESGFRAGPLETVYRLARLLAGISERFGDELLLRGGTALNLLHLDVPRLSVDIVLDFVGTADAEQARQRRPQLLAEIEALAQAAGYEVAQERASYAMAHLRLSYLDADGRPAPLKFDVNFLDRVPVLAPVRLAVQHPFGDDLATSTMLTFALPELAATKTIALVRRALARDLFDAAMLAMLPDLDVERMQTVLVVRGASYPPPSPRDYSLDVVDRVRAISWRSEVLALCRRPLPVTLEEARVQATDLLQTVTELDPGHLEFLEHLERGELRPDVLPEAELRDRVAANPGLLWRQRVGAEALEER